MVFHTSGCMCVTEIPVSTGDQAAVVNSSACQHVLLSPGRTSSAVASGVKQCQESDELRGLAWGSGSILHPSPIYAAVAVGSPWSGELD